MPCVIIKEWLLVNLLMRCWYQFFGIIKASVELQREIKEITVGSVQELLHKLLLAESTFQERECNPKKTGGHTRKVVENTTTEKAAVTPRKIVKDLTTKQEGEMILKHVKCFNC